ncbi:hypothetical protein BVRB_1g017790 [Beta vulgaris subsp. vulgaris]|nr:hypothetical protein BVRB_1g017790 [Beta vulgaris subsp. vulgaris]
MLIRVLTPQYIVAQNFFRSMNVSPKAPSVNKYPKL